MSEIDIDKFICSLRKELCETQYFELIRIIDTALEEQGCEYKDGEIIEIEEQKPLTEEQKAFIDECLKNGSMIRWSDLAYADGGKPDTIHFDKEPEKEEATKIELTKFEEEIIMAISDYECNKEDGFTEIQSGRKHASRILNAAIDMIVNDIDISKMAAEYGLKNFTIFYDKGYSSDVLAELTMTYKQGLEDLLNLIKKGE